MVIPASSSQFKPTIGTGCSINDKEMFVDLEQSDSASGSFVQVRNFSQNQEIVPQKVPVLNYKLHKSLVLPSGNEDRSNGDWIVTTVSSDGASSSDKDFAQIFGSGTRKVLGDIVYQHERKAIFSDGSFKLSPKEGAEVTGEWQQYPQFVRNDFVNSQDQGSYY